MAADNVSAGEAAETGPPSRTARKKASERLQDLGAELVEARASLVAGLKLPERLREAIVDAKGMRSFGAKRRQLQFIRAYREIFSIVRSELDAVAFVAERAAE